MSSQCSSVFHDDIMALLSALLHEWVLHQQEGQEVTLYMHAHTEQYIACIHYQRWVQVKLLCVKKHGTQCIGEHHTGRTHELRCS